MIKFILSTVFSLFFTLYEAWIITVIWAWFVANAMIAGTTVGALPFSVAVGIVLLTQFFQSNFGATWHVFAHTKLIDADEDKLFLHTAFYVITIVKPTAALCVGYLVHLFV